MSEQAHESTQVQEAAQNMIELGLSVIPTKPNKKAGPWKQYKSRRLTKEEIPQKFNGSKHIAIIGGEISGNLECLDIDDITVREELVTLIKTKHRDILDRLVFTKTPNGFGLVYRCEVPVSGNLKLAKGWEEVEGPGEYEWNDRTTLEAFEADGKWVVSPTKLETRGEGGYFLIKPSPGYDILEGALEKLEPITDKERNSILGLARSFDERPEEHRPSGKEIKYCKQEKKRIPWPGDVYNQSINFKDLLEEYGWKQIGRVADGITFSRPGRKKEGATLYDDGRLHVFSSNAAPLEEGKQYTAYAFLTFMEFEGNFSESTKSLIDAGYSVDLTVDELKDILEDNPDALEDAYDRSGLSEASVSQVAADLGIPLPPGRRPNRIEVFYNKLELNRVVGEVDNALVKVIGDWGYFTFSEQLGYVSNDNRFRPYDKDTLELRCEQSMYMTQWSSAKKPTLESIRVHSHVLNKLLSYPDTKAPMIKGFAKHPVVLSSGDVIGLRDGFQNGIMFKDCEGFQIDKRSFKECYDRIVEIFCGDILFKNDALGQALFISMMMTGLTRLGIEGGCPGYFITANEPGTGKSTMFEFVSRIVYGTMVESVDWGSDAVERRKEIIAYLREGIECFVFDNIQQGEEVKSPILAQALTAGEFKARIMGKGEMTYVPAQSMFVFIGNNLNMSSELARRLMTVELLAKRQNPAQREVAVTNIPQWCEDHREEVIGCLLKMIQEGTQMSDEIKRSSGFTYWDKMVRNPLLVQTGIDIAAGFEISSDSSEETTEIGELLENLAGVFGIGNPFIAREVYLAIADERFLNEEEMKWAGNIRSGCEDECSRLKDTMLMVNAKSATVLKVVGRILSNLKDRVVDDKRFCRHETKSKQPVKCWIELIEDEAGDADESNEANESNESNESC